MTDAREPVLCYAEDGILYFTTQDIARQWGDDWNDAPYEHNAGPPYGPRETFSRFDQATGEWQKGSDYTDGVPHWEITRYRYEGPFRLPHEGHCNSPYSVQDINAGQVPWLETTYEHRDALAVRIYGGTPLSRVLDLIIWGDGKAYPLT